MEAVAEYRDRKAELEERIRSYEAEKGVLQSEISSLKEKIATMELERAASVLESEVASLRNEKAALEEKASSYYPESEEQSRTQDDQGYQS